jgi:hypothetical protein
MDCGELDDVEVSVHMNRSESRGSRRRKKKQGITERTSFLGSILVAETNDADRSSLETVEPKGGTDEVDLARALPPIRDAI